MQRKIVPIVMAGGTGKRLWPVSRDGLPKQFLPLVGPRSSYQETLVRVSDPAIFAPPIVITNADYRFFAEQQALEVGCAATILLEPMRRDSALAIASATAYAHQRDPDALLLALAADHIVLDPELFREACLAGKGAAEAARLVTFGIRPSEPRTSYGYIKLGEMLDGGAHEVAAFVEKPDAATAAAYVRDGYLWNSGNFLFAAGAMLGELARHAPGVKAAADAAVSRAQMDLGFVRLDSEAFARSPQLSIDYAVMEKTQRAAVVECRFRWSDIGSWDAVWQISDRDEAGNAIHGTAELLAASDCLVHSETGITTLVGVKDLVVVTTKDAVLVADRSKVEHVKELVNRLEKSNRREAVEHRLVRRPWGFYDSVDIGERFQVKRIVVKPGGKASLQRHYHRAEHWVVVRGAAEVTVDDDVKLVRENESIYIPLGAVHRVANPGKIPLEFIEVQSGSYLGEDDIVRLEDDYNRA